MPGGAEAGEQHGRRCFVSFDARKERDESVSGAQVDPAVPRDGAGIRGEQTGCDPIVGTELFLPSVGKVVADGRGCGQPQLVSIEGDAEDVLAVHQGFCPAILRQEDEPVLRAGENPLGGGCEAIDIIGRQSVFRGREGLPGTVGFPA